MPNGFFYPIWAGIALGGLYAGSYWPLLLIFPALCTFFIVSAVRLFRMAKYFPVNDSPDDIAREKSSDKWFGIIFGAEGLGIFIAVNVVIICGHPELAVPVIALVVGLHFFPLAWLFRRRMDYYLASYSTLVAITAMVLGYDKFFNQNQIFAFTGTGIAIATSAYGINMLFSGRKALASLESHPESIV